MIYSGADLIRNSSHQQQRRAELLESRTQPVQSVEASSSSLDEQTQGALLRFARFIKDKKDERPRPRRPVFHTEAPANPYIRLEEHVREHQNKGTLLNISV